MAENEFESRRNSILLGIFDLVDVADREGS